MVDAWRNRERREDLRFARLSALIANIKRDPKKKTQPYKEADFLPMTEEERREHRNQGIKRMIESRADMFKRSK